MPLFEEIEHIVLKVGNTNLSQPSRKQSDFRSDHLVYKTSFSFCWQFQSDYVLAYLGHHQI